MEHKLIDAFNRRDYAGMQEAIAQGADVNCRVTMDATNKVYRLATAEELAYMEVDDNFEVPSYDTTTLLNILSAQISRDDSKNLDIAKLLLDNNADLGAIDYASYWQGWRKEPANYFQNTPLLNAIASCNIKFAQLYMTYLADYEPQRRKDILDYKDKFRAGFHTALEFAIRRGYSDLATSIVKQGANVNPEPFKYAYDGQSPLHMACMSLGQSWLKSKKDWHEKLGSDCELVVALIDAGADFEKLVSTTILMKTDTTRFFDSNENLGRIELTPLDYIKLEAQNIEGGSQFDLTNACGAAAFDPQKVGQVRHGFYEDQSFRDPQAEQLLFQHSRASYLSSQQFLAHDKLKIIKALLKQAIKKDMEQFGADEHLSQLAVEDVNSFEELFQVLEVIDATCGAAAARINERFFNTGAVIGSSRIGYSKAVPLIASKCELKTAEEPLRRAVDDINKVPEGEREKDTDAELVEEATADELPQNSRDNSSFMMQIWLAFWRKLVDALSFLFSCHPASIPLANEAPKCGG